METVNRIRLPGCRPEPLSHYLKGLGVLRILGTQLEGATVRACWATDEFCLEAPLDAAELVAFFLDRYRPTPVIAPWNGGGGFWDDRAAGRALRHVEASTDPRLAPYREAIRAARQAAESLGITDAPKDESKARLLRVLRATLPDEALDWLDAVAVLTADKPQFAPILGTGGNDGNLDFSSNFMQRLADVMPFGGDWAPPGRRPRRGQAPSREQSAAWLRAALFREGDAPLLRAATGQFHPGGVGGPNATTGMEGDSMVNPWEFILLIEGALVLAASVNRRMGTDTYGRAALPFTVSATAAGAGSLTDMDEAKARAEIWLPLWRQPATWGAVRQLFAEGRAEVGHRQARNGLDFVRAVVSLGVDRMVNEFLRYGVLQWYGKSHLAVPLGRIRVQARPLIRLVDEVEGWLNQARSVAADAPQALRQAVRRAERAIFAYAQREERAALLEVLAALAEAELVVSRSRKLQERLNPIPWLSPRWLDATDDGSAEFAIAAALASIGNPGVNQTPTRDRDTEPLRYHWLPVTEARGRLDWTDPGDRDVSLTYLLPDLVTILQRRLVTMEQRRLPRMPIRAGRPLPLEYVDRFLEGRVDDGRILRLLPALALVKCRDMASMPMRKAPVPLLSRAYALLKPLCMPEPLRPRQLQGQELTLRLPLEVLARLRAGDLERSLDLAARRLHAVGLTPIGFRTRQYLHLKPPDGSPLRLAAALLLPIQSAQPLLDLILPEADNQMKGRDLV
ncbi:type I-G CRISPR-associated protein Cas8g1/Csx17 [Symbiobacterium terraclitae]|uniref:type I-G CRISPR-associated protein Cas8g1/Csx17 n=1 Tax=Symbiobacterium terraclitae TaxID=557451 RepID=UPI0035B5311A